MNIDDLLSREISATVDAHLKTRPSLGLEMVGTAPGSGADAELSFSYIRDLTIEDIVIADETTLGSTTPALKRLKDTHHTLARLLAMGKKAVEISAVTGFSQGRISILKNDPAFAELIDFYRERANEEFVDVHKRIAGVALEAVAELHERIVEDPENVKTAELIEIAKFTLDRTGHAPVNKTVNKNLNLTLTGQDIAAMKAEAQQGFYGNVTHLNRAALPANSGAEICLDGAERTSGSGGHGEE